MNLPFRGKVKNIRPSGKRADKGRQNKGQAGSHQKGDKILGHLESSTSTKLERIN